ncbi:MAG: TIGR04255 family protein [Deltaproteobacteria bacterium]|nr:TIGR04255 family protein [Deltaproteobacteria bacterium]
MSTSHVKFLHPPIVEAVLDVDCDMSPAFDLAAVEKPLRETFRDQYPRFRALFLEEAHLEQKVDQPVQVSAQRKLQAFQFFKEDEKQLIQVRVQGFTFNRLAPYTSLDDYLSEIKRAWDIFASIASPIQIRAVRLRYINRIVLPLTDGRVNCEDYLKVGPSLPDEDGLRLASFLNQYTAVNMETGDHVNSVLASQPPESNGLPIILDICVTSGATAEPTNWDWLVEKMQSLRHLKNRLFHNTLTEQCLNLFQH